MIIGLYGISGCGKTSLCKLIEKYTDLFRMIDGSVLMEEIIPGGISAFKKMSDTDKYKYREIVIREIESRHRDSSYHTIVTGHYSFLKTDGEYEIAWTEADGKVYDHIFCIKDSASEIKEQCINDSNRVRINHPVSKLEQWQNLECEKLEEKCRLKNIPFSLITSHEIDNRLIEFYEILSKYRIIKLCEELKPDSNKKYSIFDCDGTLFSGDSLDYLSDSEYMNKKKIRSIFEKNGDYCFKSFFEIAQYYSQVPFEIMQNFIDHASKTITLNPDMFDILRNQEYDRQLIWITSGFPEIWELIAHKYELEVTIVGGNNLLRSDFIVSNEEKELLVQTLVEQGAEVSAYGDSMVDAGMLKNAQQAFLVMGKKKRSMLNEYLSKHDNLSYIYLLQNDTYEVSE
ncbi:AAA family ATPase [Methanolobus sediminis]|uniref:phosphoserine phosphatase n=1 Tax=Methanolobus sediminis TaxID=3072978 RepID=A0AA51ULA3_9EURY|nr:AAA family ATPase [Methanolobus sediminis]WMW25672.1 AAA family ATPase [Methanolobus sediminis]